MVILVEVWLLQRFILSWSFNSVDRRNLKYSIPHPWLQMNGLMLSFCTCFHSMNSCFIFQRIFHHHSELLKPETKESQCIFPDNKSPWSMTSTSTIVNCDINWRSFCRMCFGFPAHIYFWVLRIWACERI